MPCDLASPLTPSCFDGALPYTTSDCSPRVHRSFTTAAYTYVRLPLPAYPPPRSQGACDGATLFPGNICQIVSIARRPFVSPVCNSLSGT